MLAGCAGCGDASGGPSLAGDTTGDSADSGTPVSCPTPAERRSADDADGTLGGPTAGWRGAGFAHDLDGAGGVGVLAWGEDDDEARLALYPLGETTSPAPAPAWALRVGSREDSEFRQTRFASGLHDLTGDGRVDLVVSTTRDDLVVLPGPVTSETRLSAFALRVTGYRAGETYAFGEDVSGDGAADVAVGMDSAVLVVDGGATGERSAADATAAIRFVGERAGYVPGVATAGDHDGDGIADLLVSTWSWTGLYLGPLSGPVGEGEADATFDGEGARGWRTAASGDLDGDGHPDVLVGAPESDGGGIDHAGRAWVLLGPSHGAVDLADAVARVEGDGAYLNLGSVVASAARSDGGAPRDLLVVADALDCATGGYVATSCNERAGAVYRFPGPVEGALDPACAEVTWEGVNGTGDRFGYLLGADLDADGSGDPDLLISSTVQVYLFLDP